MIHWHWSTSRHVLVVVALLMSVSLATMSGGVAFAQSAPTSTTSRYMSTIPNRAAGTGTIVDSGLAPFPASSFTFENRWFEHTAAGDVVVYAGASHDDRTQGVLVVRQVGQKLGPASVYRTPAHSGSVRIISAEGKKLALVSSSGAHLSFDTASRTFGP